MKRTQFFPEIPIPRAEKANVSLPVHYGTGNYVVVAEDMEVSDYEDYLEDLTHAGFEKFVENGVGFEGSVLGATYTKENIVLTVTHITNKHKTYLSVNFDLPLSEHLFYKNGYVAGNREGAKTTMYMNELWWFGNSFLFQLKNGHFIMSDGGFADELPYLIDTMEALVPEGEKPVVDAWFISHGHHDHCGIFDGFMQQRAKCELSNRICVEGVYYSMPNEKVFCKDWYAPNGAICIFAALHHRIVKNSKGEAPKLYRPQTGQRYYFCDITVDIVHCQELLAFEDYGNDFNDSSTWCLFTIDGQKLLFPGDGEKSNMKAMMDTYSRDFLNLDFMSLCHHGLNTWNEFTDYCKVKTLLATVRDDSKIPQDRKDVNDYLRANVEEWIPGMGEGTRMFEFPYQVGEYKTLPHKEWIYHKDRERP